ncbi:hypothetical protein AAFC00_003719 [Neodothiora populina]|uniref:Zinc finger C2H2 LYAR-type domain-containing protein n=1 Tax=Neodothiora populina TaxID=2781224 RepID=A0ABR3PF62_9PEZI
MVSFSCENCGDILTKKKLDPHRNQCYGASFTCIDCMVHFQGNSYKAHTSCMTEAQKYQGHLYKGEKKKGKGPQQQNQNQSQNGALVPRKATVEDEPASAAVAVIDVPPKAPSPPPTSEGVPPGVNVFDFLVSAESKKPAAIENGFSYGAGPVEPGMQRYDSYNALPGLDEVKTPASKRDREEKKSDKKRKRDNLELDTAHARSVHDQDMSDAPALHTGLTGGLNRMLSGPDFSGNEEPTPLNPDKKRSKKDGTSRSEERRKTSTSTSKSSSSRAHHESRDDRGRDGQKERRHHRRSASSSDDERRPSSRKHVKAIDYRSGSAQPRSDNQVVAYSSPADLFLSFVNKGPESERGVSINKALKRFHREQEIRGEREDDKNLWKGLRIRRNERGEYVLFA